MVWSQDPGNTLFHSQTRNPAYVDPYTVLYSDALVSGDLSGWTGNRITFQTYGAGKVIQLAADNNGPAIAISKSSIDMSSASSKELALEFSYSISSAVNNNEFGWFLTRNSTAPAVGTDASFNPRSDPSVAAYFEMNEQAGPNVRLDFYIQHSADVAIINEQYGSIASGCAGGSTVGDCMIVTTQAELTGSGFANYAIAFLNYTGSAGMNTGSDLAIVGSAVPGPTVNVLPWLQIQGVNYYIGFWVAKSGGTVGFLQNSPANTVTVNGITLGCSGSTIPGPCLQVENAVPIAAAASSPPPTIDSGGFFGPLIKALIPIGVFVMNAVLSFVGFLTNAIQSALGILETVLVAELNFLGGLLGFGNVGTSVQQMINAFIAFFTNGSFASIFTNLPSSVTRLLDLLTIYFPWLTTAISWGATIAAFFVNGINFALTTATFATNIGSAVAVTMLIVLYFVYTGDNALGGVLEFWQTALWLVVGTGLKFLIMLVNFALDVVTNIVGIIPKPMIQMSTHALPRLPLVNTDASFVNPSGLMGEIRNGNLFAVALWISGLLFTDLFESASPTLPGSIGNIVPSAAPALVALKGLIPLLEIMTFFSWTAAAFVVSLGWLTNAFDFGELPVSSNLGERPQTHFGIRVSKAEKHFQGRLNKKVSAMRELKDLQRLKGEERARRDEQIRQRELREVHGEDLKGPNL